MKADLWLLAFFGLANASALMKRQDEGIEITYDPGYEKKYDPKKPEYDPKKPEYDPKKPEYEHKKPEYDPKKPEYDPKYPDKKPEYDPKYPEKHYDPKYPEKKPEYDPKYPEKHEYDPKYPEKHYDPKYPEKKHEYDPKYPEKPYDPKYSEKPYDPKYPERANKDEYPEKYDKEYPEKYDKKYPEKYDEKYPEKYDEKYPEKYDEKYPDKYPEWDDKKHDWDDKYDYYKDKHWKPKTNHPEFFSLKVDEKCDRYEEVESIESERSCYFDNYAIRLERGIVIATPYNKWWDPKLPIFFVDSDTQLYTVSKKPLQIYIDAITGSVRYAPVGWLAPNAIALSFYKFGNNPLGKVDPSPAYLSWPSTLGVVEGSLDPGYTAKPFWLCPLGKTGQYQVYVNINNFGKDVGSSGVYKDGEKCKQKNLAAINANPWKHYRGGKWGGDKWDKDDKWDWD